MKKIKLLFVLLGLFSIYSDSYSQVLQLSISDINNANVSGDYIVRLQDGSNIIMGKQYSLNNNQINTSDILLYRVKSDGSIMWQKRYRGHQTINQPSYLLLASNGDILLSFNSYQSTFNNSNGYLMRVNPSNGNTIWSRSLRFSTNGSFKSNAGEYICQFVELNDSRIVCVGTDDWTPGNANSMITVFNNANTTSPTIQYSEVFDKGSSSNEFYSIVTDGIDCYISGSVISSCFETNIVKYNPGNLASNSGAFLWTNIIDYATSKGSCTWGSKLTLINGNLYLSPNTGNDYSASSSLSSDLIHINTINGNAFSVRTFDAPNLSYSNSGFNLFLNNGNVLNIQNPANQFYDASTLSLGSGGLIPNSRITRYNPSTNSRSTREINLQGTQSIYSGVISGNNMDLIGTSFDNNSRSAYLFKTITNYENANPFSCTLDSSTMIVDSVTPSYNTDTLIRINVPNTYMNNDPIQELTSNLSANKLCGSNCNFEVLLSSNDTLYCNNQSFTIVSNITNGSPGTSYTYAWYNQNNSTIATTPNLTTSTPGNYRLVVKGINQTDTCESFATYSITPSPLKISGNSVLCDTSINSQGVNLTAYGHTGPYVWSNGATTPTINVKKPGIYTVTVNVNGCINSSSFEVFYESYENSISLSCENGTVTLVSDNQSRDNQYSWSNGSNASSINVPQGGWYYLTVTNSQGCTAIDSIEANCCDSNLLVDIVGDSIICNHEDINLNAQNNFSNPLYSWSHDLGRNSRAVVNTPGLYYVTVCESSLGEEEGGLCCRIDSFRVSFRDEIELIGDTFYCDRNSEGSLRFSDNPNIMNFVWTMPNGSQIQNVNPITINMHGRYIIDVQYTDGCFGSDTFDVVENCCANFTASITSSKDTVCFQMDSITLTAHPANALSYEWDNGETGEIRSLIGTGLGRTYSVIITNSDGCMDTAFFDQMMRDCIPPCGGNVILSKIISSNKTIICNNGTESATLTTNPSGKSVKWSTGATFSSIVVNTPGVYWVVLTDSLGCKDSSSFTLLGKVCDSMPCDSINFGITSSKDTICSTKNEVTTITAYPSNANYSWSPIASTNKSITISSAGTYSVTVTVKGCTKVLKKTIISSECESCVDTCDWHLNGNNNVQAHNFIGPKNNADFKIRTNNIERMTVEANGNVGIGVIIPSEQLHTNAGVRFEGLTKLDSPKRIVTQDNTGKLYWSDALSFKGVKGDKGDQGIVGPQGPIGQTGATGPQGIQGLKGDKGGKGDQGNTGAQGPKGDQGIQGIVGPTGPQGPAPTISNRLTFSNPNTITSNVNGAISSTNSVGTVSTTSSGNQLSTTVNGITGRVVNIINSNQLSLNGSTLTSTVNGVVSNTITLPSAAVNFWNLGGNTNITSTNNILGITNTNANPLRFFTNNTEKMTILSNGNLGIGTNTPNQRLDVNGSGLFRNGNGWGTFNNNQILFGWNGNATYQHSIKSRHHASNNSENAIDFYIWNINDGATNVGSKQVLTLRGDGSVGIGTTSPSNRLDIQSTTFGQSGVRLRNLPNTAAVSPNLSNRVLSVDASGNIILVNDCGCNPSGGGIPNSAPMQSLSQNQETQNSNSISYSAIDYQAKISKLEEAIKEQQTQIDALKSGKTSSLKIYTNDDSELLKKENETLKNKVNSLESKFDLLEKTLMNICESGCAGLENITPKESQEIDILYQSIPNPTDDVAMINYYLAKNYQDAFIQISDLNGRIIEKITLNPIHGNGSIKVSLGKYAAQNYMYYLIVEEKIVDSKKMKIIK